MPTPAYFRLNYVTVQCSDLYKIWWRKNTKVLFPFINQWPCIDNTQWQVVWSWPHFPFNASNFIFIKIVKYLCDSVLMETKLHLLQLVFFLLWLNPDGKGQDSCHRKQNRLISNLPWFPLILFLAHQKYSNFCWILETIPFIFIWLLSCTIWQWEKTLSLSSLFKCFVILKYISSIFHLPS